jgi:long-chain acyl-CoA synthetase
MTALIKHILKTVRDRGDDSAFFYFENSEEKTLTCSQFRGLIFSCAAAIRSFSIAPGSRAILVGENSPAWPAAYLAAHLCGLTVAHGDSRFSKDEFKNIERFTKPALILCGRAFSNMFGGDVPKILLEDLAPALAEEEPEIIPLAPGQPMSIIFTSGTTSDPKGVMLSEENFLSNLAMLESMQGLITGRDRVLAMLPLHHVYPFTCTVLAPLYFGAAIIYPRSLKGEDIFAAVKNYSATAFVAIPRVLELLCDRIFQTAAAQPKIKQALFYCLLRISDVLQPLGINPGKRLFSTIHRNFKGFRFFASGGARLDTDVHKKLRALGFRIIEAYGLTETSPIAAMNTLSEQVPGSVGRAALGVELKIEKADSHLDQGEICIRGPNVMMGYCQRQDLTAEVVIDGWFHSGDLGYLDDRGHLFITGRKKEVLVLSSGKNIYPEELEKLYRQSERIKELCITLLSEDGREFLAVVIYPNKDYFVREKSASIYQDIKYEIETIAHTLPSYQRVTRIELVDEDLPKTSLGKIKRYRVAELLREKSSSAAAEREDLPAEDQDPFLVFVQQTLKLKKIPSHKSNLDTDLGLDSLAKLEFFFAVEERYRIKIAEEQAGNIFTLRDIRALIHDTASFEAEPESAMVAELVTGAPDIPLDRHVASGSNAAATAARFCFYMLCKTLLKLFFRARLEGVEHLRNTTPPFIIAPNHNSYIDGIVIYALLPFSILNRCFFVSLVQMFGRLPLSLAQKIGRIILTGTHDTAIRSLQYSYQILKAGGIMCVFPEGMRSVDGAVAQPKKGIGYAAQSSGAALLPVCIEGTQALLSRKNPGLHCTKITVTILPPIAPEGGLDDFLGTWRRTVQDYHDKKNRR